MSIESSLISLDKAIREGRTLSAGSKVVLPIGEEAEIYGFIAIEDDDLLSIEINMPPLGECKVLSNRTFFSFEGKIYHFPIFSTVSRANEEKYKLYLLYVPKFFNLTSKYDVEAYRQSMRNEVASPKVYKINGVRVEDKIAYYYANESDLYFRSRSKLSGIGSEFAVITRRVSKLSEDVKYELFDSYGVMIEK